MNSCIFFAIKGIVIFRLHKFLFAFDKSLKQEICNCLRKRQLPGYIPEDEKDPHNSINQPIYTQYYLDSWVMAQPIPNKWSKSYTEIDSKHVRVLFVCGKIIVML